MSALIAASRPAVVGGSHLLLRCCCSYQSRRTIGTSILRRNIINNRHIGNVRLHTGSSGVTDRQGVDASSKAIWDHIHQLDKDGKNTDIRQDDIEARLSEVSEKVESIRSKIKYEEEEDKASSRIALAFLGILGASWVVYFFWKRRVDRHEDEERRKNNQKRREDEEKHREDEEKHREDEEKHREDEEKHREDEEKLREDEEKLSDERQRCEGHLRCLGFQLIRLVNEQKRCEEKNEYEQQRCEGVQKVREELGLTDE